VKLTGVLGCLAEAGRGSYSKAAGLEHGRARSLPLGVMPNSERSRTKPEIEQVLEPGHRACLSMRWIRRLSLVGPQYSALVRGALVAVQVRGLVVEGFVASREIVRRMPKAHTTRGHLRWRVKARFVAPPSGIWTIAGSSTRRSFRTGIGLTGAVKLSGLQGYCVEAGRGS